MYSVVVLRSGKSGNRALSLLRLRQPRPKDYITDQDYDYTKHLNEPQSNLTLLRPTHSDRSLYITTCRPKYCILTHTVIVTAGPPPSPLRSVAPGKEGYYRIPLAPAPAVVCLISTMLKIWSMVSYSGIEGVQVYKGMRILTNQPRNNNSNKPRMQRAQLAARRRRR